MGFTWNWLAVEAVEGADREEIDAAAEECGMEFRANHDGTLVYQRFGTAADAPDPFEDLLDQIVTITDIHITSTGPSTTCWQYQPRDGSLERVEDVGDELQVMTAAYADYFATKYDTNAIF